MKDDYSIQVLEEIDQQFLTEILQKAGHPDARIKQFNYDTIGTGQIGKCVRFHLQYLQSTTAPKTLIGKFPSDDANSRKAAAHHGLYIKEFIFYSKLAPKLSIAVPKCYYSAISKDKQDFTIIMEDMAPFKQGDQFEDGSLPLITRAVRTIAGLHVASWNNFELFSEFSVLRFDQKLKDFVHNFYKKCFPAFEKKYSKSISKEQMALFEKVKNYNSPLFTTDLPHISIVHADFRLDNLLIEPNSDDPNLTIVDWQTFEINNPLSDVAYMIATSFTFEDRRKYEEQIVKEYYHQLIASGIQNFTWADCWKEYRRAALFGFTINVLASSSVQQTERGEAMFFLMVNRISQMAVDLKAEEFLV